MENEITPNEDTGLTDIPQLQRREENFRSHITNRIRDLFATLFWLYVILKLFIFDIDLFLINKFFPNYSWLSNFKLFVLIGSLAIIWLFTKNRHIVTWSLYILFFPLIVIFWKVPRFVLKQKSWIFTFAVINALLSFIKSIKYNFIVLAFFLVSVAIIFNFSDQKLLWFSLSMLFIILTIIYVHRFILVFKPSSIYQAHIKILTRVRMQGLAPFALEENIRNLPVESLDKKQLEKWTTSLQTSVLFNRVCLFTAKKLRNYQNSGFDVVSDVLTIILLILMTVFSFSMINFGLYKINHDVFTLSTSPSFFTFFYYSFNNLWLNSINEVVPIMPVSQVTFMIESLFSFFLIAIFLSLLFSVKSKRHEEELNEVIRGIEGQGKDMEHFIKDEYRINSIEDAMAELDKLKASLAKFLYKISESIK
ncbi:MAG: hypothetical protein COU47_01835 [Candidatus Niyogibacteria bacterium CG10_big_fil_rev_8_21_14_0_10_46_36]|uniref:Uncharacterized protein n=1 Tax=Candidatus Niyogibacteria bacterium CG10_big_fil_rev_8_21_14_0_10_46_36 TaxID=1974726 RepID=A0A2H0TF96_9BACT|nr:MAG: hypothetical protein COU47_01835 [Candidatus Niyogibacteria bacterium CG10_big_fil_rev_8_21_14_0_10_46_36]